MMKSALIVIGILAVIVVGAHYADKATRLPHTSNSVSAARMDSPNSGKPEPDLTLKDLDGKNLSLAQLKGKVVLVNFWATWCEPCQYEIPELIEMQQKYGAKGFTVLGVAMDEEGRSVVAPFVETKRFDVGGGKSQMNFPIVIGNDDAAEKFGGLLGYPTSVLIDRNGKQIKRVTGPINADEFSKIVESQL
jgi:thiol-disulfide isomerase/thioredoxin